MSEYLSEQRLRKLAGLTSPRLDEGNRIIPAATAFAKFAPKAVAIGKEIYKHGKEGWSFYQEETARRRKVAEVLLQKYEENDNDYHYLIDYLTKPYIIRVMRMEINNRREDIKELQKDGQFVDDIKAEVSKLERALIRFAQST